jgi:hypothetical protein
VASSQIQVSLNGAGIRPGFSYQHSVRRAGDETVQGSSSSLLVNRPSVKPQRRPLSVVDPT